VVKYFPMTTITPTSTIITAILTPQKLQPTPYTAGSLAEAARHEPPGVYTVARTYHRTMALCLDAHWDRLEESARLLEIPLRLDRQSARDALRQLILESGYPESRFRITAPADAPDHLYFAIEPFKDVPAEVRANGARVQSVNGQRSTPKAKNTAWMETRAHLSLPEGVYEGLLIRPDGAILEGMSSNFYAIRDGALYTAQGAVLPGISRRIVLEVAPEVLPVHLEPVRLADVPRLQEAFLTSAGRGVVPIVEIDGQRVNGGRPGPFTRAIERRYNAWTEAHLEEI